MRATRKELKNIRALLTRKGRRLAEQFSAEGIRLLEEALRADFLPKQLYVAESTLTDRSESLVRNFSDKGVPITSVGAADIEYIADSQAPQGLVAVFRMPSTDLSKLSHKQPRRVLLLEDLSDPGNLGTLMRSAMAFDFKGLILTGNSVEPFSPKVVRSSVGALFGLPIAVASTSEALAMIAKKNWKLLATATGRGPTMKKTDKSQTVVLAIGSEADGLSPEIQAAAKERCRIEHSNAVESLNAAVAGSILMKQIYDW